MTLVSIITPSLNQAAFLKQTMDSVFQQDHPELEYIVVDGGSSDGSAEIIRQYADRLAWWTSEPDAGQAEAINKGLQHAHGEIVAWLNSDDYYLPRAVSSAVRAFTAEPEAVLVYGDMVAVDEEGRTVNLLRSGQLSLDDLLSFQIIGQPAAFMRSKALLETGGLDTDFHFLLDHHLWIRLARVGPIRHVDQMWAAARYHAAAKNRTRAADFGIEAFRILDWAERDAELAPVLRLVGGRARASAHRLNARYLLDGGRARESLRAWCRALVLHPPTALARLNLLASGILEICGLGGIRRRILRHRQRRLSG